MTLPPTCLLHVQEIRQDMFNKEQHIAGEKVEQHEDRLMGIHMDIHDMFDEMSVTRCDEMMQERRWSSVGTG